MAKRSRLVLSLILLAAIVAAGLWIFAKKRPTEVATGVRGTTGGELVGSLRSEPAGYNRYIEPTAAADVLALLTHSSLVRVDRATDELQPGSGRELDAIRRRSELHAETAQRRAILGRGAIHVRRRPLHRPGRLRREDEQLIRVRRSSLPASRSRSKLPTRSRSWYVCRHRSSLDYDSSPASRSCRNTSWKPRSTRGRSGINGKRARR